ncbi:MAG TPA: hypothetical protein VE944_19365 [Nostoc sp.]|uniref:hypothetical protein n=1 Tax=Nostoc sp. TaxID=1180 RepID=UPI002D5B7C9C|nr:hypothetical protein [Nostoc sp.]HYX16482.1 hypothetical protein [Nostoc sp.]
MYSIASEWKQVINTSRTAIVKAGKTLPIAAIEPDAVLTHNTIAVYITSTTANPKWYKAGNLYQAFFVPFGTAGAAQGEQLRIVLNRYIIYRFTTFPSLDGNKYVLSYVPESYFKDVKLQVWEYIGTSQGATLDSLDKTAKVVLAKSTSLSAQVAKLLLKG